MITVKRPEVADRIHDAKEHGDLSENAEYEDAKNEQAFVEGRIQTLEALIKNATLIDENHSTDHVQIGSTVSVESGDGKETFTIVGSTEAKPGEGRISNESPVGRALLGQEEGREGRREGARGRLHVQDQPASPRRLASEPLRPRGVPVETSTMDWADELAERVRDAGPQVVNDSKTPSGTVHVGSLRGPVILDAITRALRANGIETTLLYGVDDLDPMDAQALLTPDAVETRDGPPARQGARPGRRRSRVLCPPPRPDLHRHVRGPGHPPRPLLLDERHLPDRRRGPVHPDRAGQGRTRPRDLPSCRERPASGHVAPAQRHLRELRQGRDHDRDPMGRRARLLRVPAGPGRRGPMAAAIPVGSRRSRVGPSCHGTSNGPRSGRCSA